MLYGGEEEKKQTTISVCKSMCWYTIYYVGTACGPAVEVYLGGQWGPSVAIIHALRKFYRETTSTSQIINEEKRHLRF